MIDTPLSNFLVIVSGVCWTIVYIDLIRKGFKDKVCGMPLFALGLNIAWEFIYSIDGFFINKQFILVQCIGNLAWALCDVVILVTWFKYGKQTMPENSRKYFVPFSILSLITCLAVQLAFYLHIENVTLASQYSAFAQNLAMSVMFLTMLFQRNNTKGQSMLIAVCKCIGTVTPTILGGFVESINIYIILTGGFSFLFDLIYIYFLNRMIQHEKHCK